MKHPLAAILLSGLFLVLHAGCAMNYVRYAEFDRGTWSTSREFSAPEAEVWRAMLVALEKFPVAFTDRESCFIRTETVEADAVNVFRLSWSSSEPELDRPAYARFSIHVSCSQTSGGKTRVHVYLRERISFPALKLVPYGDQPRPVLVDVTSFRRIPAGGDSASIGYREQLLLGAIGKLLGEEAETVELGPVSKDRCVAAFEDDGSVVDCPGAPKAAPRAPSLQP